MNTYLNWNDALARHFFRPELAGQPVWLYVTDDLINEGPGGLTGGVADFVDAAKTGPPWVAAGSLCQRAVQSYDDWRNRDLEYPPYVAYLGLFVLAAGLEGDFAPHAYYPRLRRLLGDPTNEALPSFHRMLELWDDLERWSTRDRQGSLGLFVARVVGGWIHVGLPLAQTILSEQERRALPGAFAAADLDPTSPPPDDELLRALRMNATSLRPRTRSILSSTKRDSEVFAVLLDAVADELADWDGSLLGDARDEEIGRAAARYGTLRLCLRLDRVAGRVAASLRCRTAVELPDDGLVLQSDSLGLLSCDGTLPGWSSQLVEAETGDSFDAACIDWMTNLTVRNDAIGWYFTFSGRRVRILVDGRAEGLPGLVDVRQVPRTQPFYLLYRDADWHLLQDWAENDCRDFKTLAIRDGLSSGWQLAFCEQAVDDSRIRSQFPELAFTEHLRITLVGGIRSAPGPNFFAFAAPAVRLEGETGSEEVRCGEVLLEAAPESRLHALPDGLASETHIVVDVSRGGDVLKRQSLYLTGEFDWQKPDALGAYDEWGAPTAGAGVVGASVSAPYPDTSGFTRSPLLAAGIDRTRVRTVFFVGRARGEVVRWPVEPLPDGWDPVWAVPMGRRGEAVYCGGDIDQARLTHNPAVADRRKIALWKDVLWTRRKRIAPPRSRSLARLWKDYVEAGRDV